MTLELERKKAFLIRFCYYALIIAVIYAALRWLWVLLLPFVLGFIVAFMLRPATNFIARHSRIKRRSAAIVSAIVFYTALAVIFWIAAAVCVIKTGDFIAALPEIYASKLEPAIASFSDKLVSFTAKFLPRSNISDTLAALNNALGGVISSVAGWGAQVVAAVAKSLPMAAITFIFTVISSVLICADYGDVTGFLMRQIPKRFHAVLLETRDFLVKTLAKIVKTYLILMVITFALLAPGLWIIGVKNFAVYAAIIAFVDLLPVLGSGAIMLPWGLVMLVMGNSFTGVGMLLLWVIISVIREILEPRILGGQIGLHPLATLTAMYFGLKLAGFGGLIFAPVICLLAVHLCDKGVIKLHHSDIK